jgi:hypothetical protein
MKLATTLLLLIGFWNICFSAALPFRGMRVIKTLDLLQTDNIFLIQQFMKEVQFLPLPPIEVVSGTDFTKQGLFLANIQAWNMSTNTSALIITKTGMSKGGEFYFESQGNASHVDVKFDWSFEFMGVHVFFGDGNVALESTSLNFTQNYEQNLPKTSIEVVWEIQDLWIKGVWGTKPMEKWIRGAIETYMLANVTLAMNERIDVFDDQIMSEFYSIPIKYPNNLNMTILNTLYNVASFTDEYSEKASFGYISNITVDDRPYNKMIWREISTDASGLYDLAVCYPMEIIPAFLEVQAKSRYFYWSVNVTEVFGLADTVSGFADVFPELADRYPSTEKVSIGCRPIDMIVDLVSEKSYQHLMQIPVVCTFDVRRTGERFLNVDVFFRANYEAKRSEIGNLFASIENVEIAHIFPHPHIPATQLAVVINMLTDLCDPIAHIEILHPGISTPFFRNDAQYKEIGFTARAEDVCFWYQYIPEDPDY